MKRASAVALLAVGALALAHASYAQLGTTDPVTLTVTPNYPQPYQSVTIVPESTVIDLLSSAVTVTVNGTVISKGTGSEPIYVTMGGPGSASKVNVSAVFNGQTYTKSITLRPADVALVIEPQSTVHPFYEGGSLIASQGRVRLIAIPDLRSSNGAPLPAASLVYTWRNGDQILEDASGIGKSVLNATSPVRYRDALVTVTVSTQDKSIVAQAATTIAPTDPLIRIYRDDPLLGPLFGAALPSDISLSGTEDTYRAVPYFFASAPRLNWTVNGSAGGSDRDLTVRSTGQGSGAASLGIAAGAADGSQSANGSYSVHFGTGSNSFLGL